MDSQTKQNKKNEPTEKQTERKNWEKPGADSNPKQRSFKKVSKGMFEYDIQIDLLHYSE